MIEAALWLKAIYFDSGVAQTPEQAIAKAYDCMPGHTTSGFHPGLSRMRRFDRPDSSFFRSAALSRSRCASTIG